MSLDSGVDSGTRWAHALHNLLNCLTATNPRPKVAVVHWLGVVSNFPNWVHGIQFPVEKYVMAT